MKLLALIFITTVLLLSLLQGSSGAPCTSLKEFTLFPNPVMVGQTAHIRAIATLPVGLQTPVTSGTIKVSVKFNGESALQLANIPLCDSTSSIVCSSLGAGDNALSFDFEVPDIPIGSYEITVTANVGSATTICQTFTVNVTNPSHKSKQYISFVEASLAGTAQFENSNVFYRAVGEVVQIGPIGYAPVAYSTHYDWGKFLNIEGSEDVIVPHLSASGYVWGLYGNLTDVAYAPNTRSHTYRGTYYVGYVNDLSKRALDVEIITGTFTLTWAYKFDLTGTAFSKLTGSITFNDDFGTLPEGWNYPIVLEKFGSLNVSTNDNGVLTVTGNRTYCLYNNSCVDSNTTIVNKTYASPIVATKTSTPSSGLSDKEIILAVVLTVGVAMLAAIIIVLALWLRRSRKFEEEDGIFSGARKPEYGSALVVDDIIQETREHGNSPIIPTLDRRAGDTESEYSDLSEDESELSNHRRSRFSREAGSPSSRRPRSPSVDDRSRERERGGRRQRSRSNSVASAGRRSRSPPRRDDDSSSYYSDAGSSASRASSSDD